MDINFIRKYLGLLMLSQTIEQEIPRAPHLIGERLLLSYMYEPVIGYRNQSDLDEARGGDGIFSKDPHKPLCHTSMFSHTIPPI